MDVQDIRALFLEVIAEQDKPLQKNPNSGSLQSTAILHVVEKRVNIPNIETEQAILTCWYDLFRNGIMSWGYNLSNEKPPFCHITEHGRKVLENLSRDPSNPLGYLAFLSKNAFLNPIAYSYITEALNTYNTNCIKASAVMVGAAAESLIFDIRDAMISNRESLGLTKLSDLEDWRIKRISVAIEHILLRKKENIPQSLFDSFEAYWPSFTHQIRTVRNDSGHPVSIEPVSLDSVHASLLIFPELAMLVDKLKAWMEESSVQEK